MRLTDAQFRRRCETWQKRLAPLGVAHWRLESCEIVDEAPGGPNASASMWISDDYDTCRMYISAAYLAHSDSQELDETILHEWLHVAFRDLMDVADNAETWFTVHAWEDHKSHLKHSEENLIENLARALYALYAG